MYRSILITGGAGFIGSHLLRRWVSSYPQTKVINLDTLTYASDIDNLKYTTAQSEVGYENFCVIETYFKSIEWLYLAAKGHRRAFFSLKNNSLEKKWLIP